MIPGNRFSLIPIAGTLLNPLSVNRLIGYAWGPIAVQDPSAGLLYKVWTITAIDASVYLEAVGSPSVLLFTRPSNIHNVSLAFDPNGSPQVAFQESSVSYLYWFDPVPNNYVFMALPVGSTYPYVTLDDARPENNAGVDNILGYIRAGAVRFSQLRDRFTIEYTPTVGVLGPPVAADILYYVGMNSLLRLEFVYGGLPTIRDTPDIMKRQVLTQKAPVEVLDIPFDFNHLLRFGDPITSAAAVVTVHTGDDLNPAAMLSGLPTHTDTTVTQTVIGGNDGDVYLISMSARTADNCVYVVEGYLYVNNNPAVSPP